MHGLSLLGLKFLSTKLGSKVHSHAVKVVLLTVFVTDDRSGIPLRFITLTDVIHVLVLLAKAVQHFHLLCIDRRGDFVFNLALLHSDFVDERVLGKLGRFICESSVTNGQTLIVHESKLIPGFLLLLNLVLQFGYVQ